MVIRKVMELSMDKLVVYALVTVLLLLGGWTTLTIHEQAKEITELRTNLIAAKTNVSTAQKTIDTHVQVDRETTQHFVDQLNGKIDTLTADQKEVLKLLIKIQGNVGD